MKILLGVGYMTWLAWNFVVPGHYHHTDLSQAIEDADNCPSPVSWVERDENGEWFVVCATADGLICGDDIPEDDARCNDLNDLDTCEDLDDCQKW